MLRLTCGLTLSLFGMTWIFVQEQAVPESANDRVVEKTPAIQEKADEPSGDVETLRIQAQLKARERVVKRMMRAVHRGPFSPLVVLKKAADDGTPNWEQLMLHAEWVNVMGIALAEDVGPQQESYLRIARELKASVEAEDHGKLRTAVRRLGSSCARCHGWAPPK